MASGACRWKLRAVHREQKKWANTVPGYKVKRENQQDVTNSMFIIKLLSQHVSGIIMPIIRRIRPCPAVCGVLPGCVGCCWLWSCGDVSWVTCTQLTTQQDSTNSMSIIKLLSQHVSGIIMPIIRRIRPCPTAYGVLPGCVGCCWLWSCGAVSWVTCTQLTTQQDSTNSMSIIKLLSQHVSGIIMPIIRRIRPCPTACGVLPGCVGCCWLWSCGAVSWVACTQLTTQLHKTTTNNSLHSQAEHHMQ